MLNLRSFIETGFARSTVSSAEMQSLKMESGMWDRSLADCISALCFMWWVRAFFVRNRLKIIREFVFYNQLVEHDIRQLILHDIQLIDGERN